MKKPNLITLDHGTEVIGYPYRTARVVDAPIVIDRNTEAARKFEEELAKAAHMTADNHTCYKVKNIFCDSSLYIMCSDMEISIGGNIIVERW